MKNISNVIANHGAIIRNVHYVRLAENFCVGEAYLNFKIRTSRPNQTNRIVESIGDAGYEILKNS